MNPYHLHNRYVGMRHGESEANAFGIIISSPILGISAYGLTPRGREQVTAALALTDLDLETVILSSDFRRTREAAGIAGRILRRPVRLTTHLRERFFGRLEGTSATNYERVWEKDARDYFHEEYGVESVYRVLIRMLEAIRIMEAGYSGQTILLVSHGDPLQIVETYFRGISPAEHRSIAPMQQAEIRRYN